jgi:hypothetical protein
VDQGGVIGGLAVSLGGFEANLFRGLRSSLVETVSQTTDYAHYAKFASGFENYLEHHLTFDAKVSGFWRVRGGRLENNLGWDHLPAESSVCLGCS